MGLRAFVRRHRELLTGWLLVAFVLRAWVPAGFMPSSVDPWSLEMCRAGFAATLSPAQFETAFGHVDESPASDPVAPVDHCVFATAGAAPLPQFGSAAAAVRTSTFARADRSTTHPLRLQLSAHRARAPPFLT